MPKDVGGNWTLWQSDGFVLYMELRQDDLSGNFAGRVNIRNKAGYTDVTDAHVSDEEFTFLMGPGRYNGRFDSNGFLSGITYDTRESQGMPQATWHAGEKKFGRR
ncbi:hypothetical protein OG963_43395 (plasmid) [Streptomyces sp. NBC_01707]|uniref:hypothetical protein n=1 Tax=Streptomyces sp. NBC_01707 TaxID=2975914 RepID=UPI002F9160DF